MHFFGTYTNLADFQGKGKKIFPQQTYAEPIFFCLTVSHGTVQPGPTIVEGYLK